MIGPLRLVQPFSLIVTNLSGGKGVCGLPEDGNGNLLICFSVKISGIFVLFSIEMVVTGEKNRTLVDQVVMKKEPDQNRHRAWDRHDDILSITQWDYGDDEAEEHLTLAQLSKSPKLKSASASTTVFLLFPYISLQYLHIFGYFICWRRNVRIVLIVVATLSCIFLSSSLFFGCIFSS